MCRRSKVNASEPLPQMGGPSYIPPMDEKDPTAREKRREARQDRMEDRAIRKLDRHANRLERKMQRFEQKLEKNSIKFERKQAEKAAKHERKLERKMTKSQVNRKTSIFSMDSSSSSSSSSSGSSFDTAFAADDAKARFKRRFRAAFNYRDRRGHDDYGQRSTCAGCCGRGHGFDMASLAGMVTAYLHERAQERKQMINVGDSASTAGDVVEHSPEGAEEVEVTEMVKVLSEETASTVSEPPPYTPASSVTMSHAPTEKRT